MSVKKRRSPEHVRPAGPENERGPGVEEVRVDSITYRCVGGRGGNEETAESEGQQGLACLTGNPEGHREGRG